MNFSEAIDSLKQGKSVRIGTLVYRMKILSWVDCSLMQDVEWKIYFFNPNTKIWSESLSFSNADVFSTECVIIDDFKY